MPSPKIHRPSSSEEDEEPTVSTEPELSEISEEEEETDEDFIRFMEPEEKAEETGDDSTDPEQSEDEDEDTEEDEEDRDDHGADYVAPGDEEGHDGYEGDVDAGQMNDHPSPVYQYDSDDDAAEEKYLADLEDEPAPKRRRVTAVTGSEGAGPSGEAVPAVGAEPVAAPAEEDSTGDEFGSWSSGWPTSSDDE